MINICMTLINILKNFISEGIEIVDISKSENILATLQYYYLLSRYLVLEKDNYVDEDLEYLALYLLDEIK